MNGAYSAAVAANALSLALVGGLLFARAPKRDRCFLALLVLLMLPMNPLAYLCVRIPLDGWIGDALGKGSELHRFARTFYAPLTEEPAKLWLLLVPLLRRRMAAANLVQVAIAIGLGFGLGEAWTVAYLLAQSPETAGLPWYMFGGYIGERTMVCLMHGAFAGVALRFVFRRRAALGIVCGMALHYLGNFPIYLAREGAFGLGETAWQIVLQLWVFAYFLAMGALLAGFAYGRNWARKLLRGHVRCPGCGQLYEHPIFGVNLMHKRYERCPHCKNWHLVSAFDEPAGSA